jgi:hypothetical protein
MVKRIPELTALATLADTDVFPIVDDTNNTTKKVDASTLTEYIETTLDISAFFQETDYSTAGGQTDVLPNVAISVFTFNATSATITITSPTFGFSVVFGSGGSSFLNTNRDNIKFLMLVAEVGSTVNFSGSETFSDGTTSKPLTNLDHIFLYIDRTNNVAYIIDYKYTP